MTIFWDPKLGDLRDFNESREVGNLRLNGVYSSEEFGTEGYAFVLYFYGDNTFVPIHVMTKASVAESASQRQLKWDSTFFATRYGWGYYRVQGDSVYMSLIMADGLETQPLHYKGAILLNSILVINEPGAKEHTTLFSFLPSPYKPDSTLNPYKKPKYLNKLRKLHGVQAK